MSDRHRDNLMLITGLIILGILGLFITHCALTTYRAASLYLERTPAVEVVK